MTKLAQTTTEIVEELLPQAVLDEQEADRKERTYWEPKEVEKEERLEILADETEEEEDPRGDFLEWLEYDKKDSFDPNKWIYSKKD